MTSFVQIQARELSKNRMAYYFGVVACGTVSAPQALAQCDRCATIKCYPCYFNPSITHGSSLRVAISHSQCVRACKTEYCFDPAYFRHLCTNGNSLWPCWSPLCATWRPGSAENSDGTPQTYSTLPHQPPRTLFLITCAHPPSPKDCSSVAKNSPLPASLQPPRTSV